MPWPMADLCNKALANSTVKYDRIKINDLAVQNKARKGLYL